MNHSSEPSADFRSEHDINIHENSTAAEYDAYEFEDENEFEDEFEETQAPPEKSASGHKRLLTVLCILCIVIALAIGGVFGFIYLKISPFADYDKIMPNVYCAGVSLGGLTQEEAVTAITEALEAPHYSVKLLLPDASYTFAPTQVGSIVNADTIAYMAYRYMREDTSAFGMYKAYRNAQRTEYYLGAEANFTYSKDDIKTLAAQIAQETYLSPSDSSVWTDAASHTVSVTLGTPGHCISAGTITDAVCAAFDSMDFSDISLEYESVPLDLESVKTLCRDSVAAATSEPVGASVSADTENHTISVTAGSPGYTGNFEDLYALAEAAVQQGTYGTVTLTLTQVDPAAPDISSAIEEITCDPTEPYYYNGEVYDGTCGYTVDQNTADTLVSGLGYGETTVIPSEAIYPEKTADDVRAVLFRDQLSSYSTVYANNANRTTNLILACNALDGTVINPGEIFSFNDTVGERTADKGYQEATVYVGTESRGELGGGICQVASTIYVAALYANLEITEREEHIFFVTYVPGGLDATVYWGAQDFCFRNDTEYPIRINASVSGGYVNISIDGTDINHYSVTLDSTCLETVPYSTKTEYTASKPWGYSEVITPYTGYTYEAYQYIYDENGSLVETNYLGISEYEKRDRTYLYGTG